MTPHQATLLITGGRIIDPARGMDGVFDLLIRNGKIGKIGKNLSPPKPIPVLSAKGCWVFPGLIDSHVHLREPGGEESETIESGSRAAAAGGITSLLAMANTSPSMDTPERARSLLRKIKAPGLIRIYPVGAVTKGLKGKKLTEIGAMAKTGCKAFSDDGRCIMDSGILRKALERTHRLGIPLIEHCEDEFLSENGLINEGIFSERLGFKGIPSASEAVMVARNIFLANLTGAHIHCAHISARGSVDLLRAAKRKKIPVSAETCPHYFTLTENAVEKFDTIAKMKPPLRTKEDINAVKEGLLDGTIDVISTDHAPHSRNLKAKPFSSAPFGITGLETSFALVYNELILKKILSPIQAIGKMTSRPAKIFRLPGGELSAGTVADIAIFDPSVKWTVKKEGFFSKSSNSPFIGKKFQGKIKAAIVGGKIIYQN